MGKHKYSHRERIAAFHEAGHAVVATIVGRGFIAVVLDETGGAFRFARADLAAAATPQGALRELIVVQGGLAAETIRFARGNPASCGSDGDRAISLASRVDARAPDASRIWALRRAQDILSEHWPAVRTIADELKRRRWVESRRVRQIVEATPTCAVVYRVRTAYDPEAP